LCSQKRLKRLQDEGFPGVGNMSIFKNPQDEEKLCQVLKAFVEEWGPENVVVSVPRHWQDYSTGNLGRVRLEFGTINTVSVRVEYEIVRLAYDVQLQAA
jgi:RNase H-fold protein (predicted Holliday junction resolvase)